MKKYHYVYRITNVEKNKHYYGVRSCDRLPHEDIGIHYFSSSVDKIFISEQKEFPNRFKYKIISIYNTRIEALLKEIYLHDKLDVAVNRNFYNRVKQISIGFDIEGKTYNEAVKVNLKNKDNMFSPETIDKMRKSKLGKKRKPHSEATKAKMRASHLGKKFSDEHKANLSKSAKKPNAKPFTEEHKRNIAKARKSAEKRVFSDAARRNMAAGQKKRHAQKQ